MFPWFWCVGGEETGWGGSEGPGRGGPRAFRCVPQLKTVELLKKSAPRHRRFFWTTNQNRGGGKAKSINGTQTETNWSMSDESLITAVSECPVLYDLTLKVVFPVLPPATINAVDPHSPPGNHDRRRGSSATSAATARSAKSCVHFLIKL